MNETTIPRPDRTAPAAGNRPAPSATKPAWLIPAGLITLGLIPILANALRRVALSMDAGGAAESAAPLSLPVLLHILGATVFVLLGAFQFSARLRRRRPAWHRRAGRVLVGVGLLAAFSGLWLAAFSSLPAGSGELLFVFRLLAGIGMALSIAAGFAAIRRRDIRRHRAWMIRAVAIGLGAGTQVFTLGFGEAIFGKTQLSVALLNGAGWALNLAVAELVIRRRPRRRAGSAAARIPALP
ncbi:DUF2306 domain-containing protein [Lysobacter korlensis]|uniref:DUF2306 domain-containing protein n=1 Tax=Lysobacter korlensis TaxID=553636 RepID=A0ABV6S0M4_9GAMM